MQRKQFYLLPALLLGAGLTAALFTHAGDPVRNSSARSATTDRALTPSLREGDGSTAGAPSPSGSVALPKNYRIIYGADLQKLVNDVHTAMLENWQVAGGVAVYVSEGKVRYAQAMTGN